VTTISRFCSIAYAYVFTIARNPDIFSTIPDPCTNYSYPKVVRTAGSQLQTDGYT